MSEVNDSGWGHSPVTREEWEEKATLDLKGRPLASLQRELAKGLKGSPLYSAGDLPSDSAYKREPGEFPFLRGQRSRSGWSILPEVSSRRIDDALRWGEQAINFGADSLFFHLAGEGCQRDGVAITQSIELFQLLSLRNQNPASLPFIFSLGEQGDRFLKLFEELPFSGSKGGPAVWRGQGACPSSEAICLLEDPLSDGLARGGWQEQPQRLFVDAIKRAEDSSFHHAFANFSLPFVDAGADAVTELAVALAVQVAWLRAAEAAKVDLEFVAPRVVARLSLSTDLFLSLAKLRVFRRLRAELHQACGIDLDNEVVTGLPSGMIHVLPSQREWTRYAHWVNLLRSTVAGVAGSTGGADSISIPAFDSQRGSPTELGQRLAINTQIILKEEGQLGQVIDPAGGSYYIESLCDSLAAKAWAAFQEIESDGGLFSVLASGALQRSLREQGEGEGRALATGKRSITGVTSFPYAESASSEPASDVNTDFDNSDLEIRIEPLLPSPLAEPFEVLRDLASRVAKNKGVEDLQVPVLRFGGQAATQARAEFAGNFVGVGGLRLETTAIVDDLDGLARDREQVLNKVKEANDLGVALLIPSAPTFSDLSSAEQERLIEFFEEAEIKRLYLVLPPPKSGDELEGSPLKNASFQSDWMHRKANRLELLRPLLEEAKGGEL